MHFSTKIDFHCGAYVTVVKAKILLHNIFSIHDIGFQIRNLLVKQNQSAFAKILLSRQDPSCYSCHRSDIAPLGARKT